MSDKSTATPAPPAEKHVGEPFPKTLYKTGLAPKEQTAPDPPVEVKSCTVNNEEEEKKAKGEGWSEDPPQPPKAGDVERPKPSHTPPFDNKGHEKK